MPENRTARLDRDNAPALLTVLAWASLLVFVVWQYASAARLIEATVTSLLLGLTVTANAVLVAARRMSAARRSALQGGLTFLGVAAAVLLDGYAAVPTSTALTFALGVAATCYLDGLGASE
jgi:hypothetical protein